MNVHPPIMTLTANRFAVDPPPLQMSSLVFSLQMRKTRENPCRSTFSPGLTPFRSKMPVAQPKNPRAKTNHLTMKNLLQLTVLCKNQGERLLSSFSVVSSALGSLVGSHDPKAPPMAPNWTREQKVYGGSRSSRAQDDCEIPCTTHSITPQDSRATRMEHVRVRVTSNEKGRFVRNADQLTADGYEKQTGRSSASPRVKACSWGPSANVYRIEVLDSPAWAIPTHLSN